MSTLTSILSTDLVSDSRTTINTSFNTLNTDKVETSVLLASYMTSSTVSGTYDNRLPAATASMVLAGTSNTVAVTPSTLGVIRIVKSNVSSVFSNTLTADTDLRFNMGSNEVWQCKTVLISSVFTGADLQYSFSAPQGAAVRFTNVLDQQLYASNSILAGITGIGTIYTENGDGIGNYHVIDATVIGGANPGSVAVLLSQNTNVPSSALSMLPGSHIIAHRLN